MRKSRIKNLLFFPKSYPTKRAFCCDADYEFRTKCLWKINYTSPFATQQKRSPHFRSIVDTIIDYRADQYRFPHTRTPETPINTTHSRAIQNQPQGTHPVNSVHNSPSSAEDFLGTKGYSVTNEMLRSSHSVHCCWVTSLAATF
jgi:hypothetical protein